MYTNYHGNLTNIKVSIDQYLRACLEVAENPKFDSFIENSSHKKTMVWTKPSQGPNLKGIFIKF